MSVSRTVESSIFAFSAASFSLCIAILSFVTSTPWSFLNSSEIYFTRTSSISVPPSSVSPLVDCTSNIPSPNSITVTSSVPPPKSNTRIFCSLPFLSTPYARDAAVGSLTILITSSPAIFPASFVACLWLSSKYAGTVTTAFSTLSPRNSSASFFIFCRINALSCCGVYSFPRALYLKLVPIFLLNEVKVFSGLLTACLFAGSPTNTCPSFVKATYEGNAFP